MPTAEDYWRAAADFAACAREVTDEGPPLAASLREDVVRGGRLRALLDDAIDGILHGIGATAEGLDAIAAECRRRAVLCQEYTAAWQAHLRSVTAWEAAAPAQRTTMAILPAPPREPWMQAG